MVSIKALLILVVFTISYVSAEDCGKFFKVDSKPAEVSETCAKELKLDPTAAPKTEEEFKKDFDDKVFGIFHFITHMHAAIDCDRFNGGFSIFFLIFSVSANASWKRWKW